MFDLYAVGHSDFRIKIISFHLWLLRLVLILAGSQEMQFLKVYSSFYKEETKKARIGMQASSFT
jgi:hypothetical protein